VLVDGTPVAVTLHPPTGTRASWYAFWSGLETSKSTGTATLDDAVRVVENMLRNGGKRPDLGETVLSDDDFEEIQRRHYQKKTDPSARSRAEKTLEDCLDAIAAFRQITGLKPITLATPDDCERFQREARRLPKNWRRDYPKKKETTECLSPNTVLKWSRSLLAAFERANRNAGRKCVRGVVGEKRLLMSNPWSQFTWIDGLARPKRRFTGEELLSLLDHLETSWSGVGVGPVAAKVFLWSGCRKSEIAGLTWEMERKVGREVHFEIVGKHGVRRWFRIPEAVHRELLAVKTDSQFVFAAYSDQIQQVHQDRPGTLKKIRREFDSENFADWFYRRVKEWSEGSPNGRAYVHHFRKTTLQQARRGEDINRRVAEDARVGEAVMMTSYVTEEDEELRHRSNRTFWRIVASLPLDVARRYGYVESATDRLEQQLLAATAARDWSLARRLATKLETAQATEAIRGSDAG
jgi:integrase